MNPTIAVILAAGLGMRLNPVTENMPKCLIKIGGRSLIERCISLFVKYGVKTFVVVTGFKGEKIRGQLGEDFSSARILYVDNPLYGSTNNIYSLWLAREYLENGAFIIESDVICEERVVEQIMRSPHSSAWLVDRFKRGMDGCLLSADALERITSLKIVRTDLPEYTDSMFKSVGILKIDGATGKVLSSLLDKEIQDENKNIYYDLVFSKYIDMIPISICNIEGLRWAEIDNAADLQFAITLFSSMNNGL